MRVKFKPLADRVLIEPAAAEQVTASGIIIPDTAKEKPLKGTVIAKGKKADQVEIDNVVLFGPTSGSNIKVNNKDFLIMGESDIYGKISN